MQGVFTCIKAFTCIILEWIVTVLYTTGIIALSDVNALHAAILTKELNTTNLEALKHILSDPERISMQVQRLQEFARFLNEELNTFSLIFRLPTELLLNVMYFVAQDEDGLESLIACSRVCRVLRAITIQSPRLWYHAMDMGAPENCVLIALARSHPHHLRISVDLPHQFNSVKLLNHELNLLHIMKSMHRIKSLNLNLVLPQFLHQVLIKFPNSSHSLEYLAIGAVAGTAHVPDVVFALDAPRLQSLRIMCCTFSWDALRFHNLLELRIFDAPKHPGVKPSLSMLLNMLSSLPLLKVVVLHNVLSDLDYIFGTDLPLVLPALETLEIEALSPDCTLFLSSIDTPSLISLKIIEEITEFADPIQDLFESIRNKVRNLTIHALQVVCSPNHWEVAGFSQGLHSNAHTPLTVSFQILFGVFGRQALSDTLVSMSHSLPVSLVRCLQLHTCETLHHDISDLTWHTFLSNFTAAEHLHLIGVPPPILLRCLRLNEHALGVEVPMPLLTLLDVSPIT